MNLIKLCAWCSRHYVSDGNFVRWVIPSREPFTWSGSHGICPICYNQAHLLTLLQVVKSPASLNLPSSGQFRSG